MRQLGITVYDSPAKPGAAMLVVELWSPDESGKLAHKETTEIGQSRVLTLLPGQELRIRPTEADTSK